MTEPFKNRQVGVVALVLFCATALLFVRSMSAGFVNYDDPMYVTGNLHVRQGLCLGTLRWAFTTTEGGNWNPVTWLSHALDWSLFGDWPAGHHATAVLLHSLNATLAFLVLRRLTGALWASAACAALFAFHPLRVESVTWIAERRDVLSGVFWWLSLWAYTVYCERHSQPPSTARRWYALSLFVFALGLSSKPMLVTLPIVFCLLDFWPLRRFQANSSRNQSPPRSNRPWALVAEKIPFFLLSVLAGVITYLAQREAGAVGDTTFSCSTRLANALVSVPRYLGKIFWPAKLSVIYLPSVPAPLTVVVSVALVVGTGLFGLMQRRRRPWIPVGWLWFLVTLAPVSGIVQIGLQSMPDRYTYLPVFGLQIALAWSVGELVAWKPGLRRLTIGLGAVCILTLVLATWRQQAVWKNSFTLFDHATKVTERNFVAWNNLGVWFDEQQNYTESMVCFRKAIEYNPGFDPAHTNLASTLAKTGAYPEALAEYQIALQLNPDYLKARRGYAAALTDSNHLDEALAQYKIILDTSPNDSDALNSSGLILETQGRYSPAEKMFLAALTPSSEAASADTRINLGSLYAMTGRFIEAAEVFQKVLTLLPNNPEAHNNLANVLVNQGKLTEAVSHYQQALKLQPNNLDARSNLGFALFRLGRLEESRGELRQVLALRPDHARAQALLVQVEAQLHAATPSP